MFAKYTKKRYNNIMDKMQRVLDFCKEHDLFNKKQKVGVGISGGADSVFLLYFLAKYKDVLGVDEIIAIHVNHNLRGTESDEDAEFVKRLCANLNTRCEIVSVDVNKYVAKQKVGVEEAARILRYEAFDKIRKEQYLDTICLAHHKNDQAETVLMHILRGAGIQGAIGMLPKHAGYVRPLLCISREDIECALKEAKIKYRTDSTNSNTNYTRNFIRKEVLGRAQKVYPGCVDAICEFSKRMLLDEEFISGLLDKYIVDADDGYKMSSAVEKMAEPLRYRVYMLAFKKAGAYKDIESKHLKMIDDMLKMKNGAEMHFPMHVTAHRIYGGILFTGETDFGEHREIPFAVPQRVVIGDVEIETNWVDAGDVHFNDNTHYLDYMKIPENAIWRSRRANDEFAKLGSGRKKLNDYLTDKKIPKVYRDKQIVLASKNIVLAVASYDIGEIVKIDNTTDRIVEINYRRR